MNASVEFSNLGLGAAAAAPKNPPASSLGQDQFLTLMTTQLQNQDPFKPMESGEFLGQIAQFSTVNGIADLNESFGSLASSLSSSQSLQAASLVGRNALIAGDTAYPAADGSVRGAIELPSSATEVTVEITAPSGEVLRRIELGARAQGLSQFEWDGLNSFGEAVDLSEVRVRATASSQGQSNAVPTFVEGRVNSVLLDGLRGIVLNIQGAGSVPFADVRQLS